MASDKWEFANKNFKRGQKELLSAIKRQKSQSYVPIRHVGVQGNSASNLGHGNIGSTSTGARLMERNTHHTNLSSENEKLKKENENLKSQLNLVNKRCDELVTFLRDNVNVEVDQINHIIQQGTSGFSRDAVRSDDVIGIGKNKGQEGVKLFGVWVKGGGGEGKDKAKIENGDGNRRKRGPEEAIGSEIKKLNN
ncbi:unnamed protein product [Lathyrus sativus]|nr:unnamed protein product [Lathyrus sativus]